jgi:hypothetical protein
MDDLFNNKQNSSTPTGKDPSDPTPNPSPFSKNENGEGSSLAVLQFVALMRGEWAVQAPTSPFRVERVTAEKRYCLGCCGVRVHDVVEGFRFQVPGVKCEVAVCRCCGKEVKS